jgi:hypothetical protein
MKLRHAAGLTLVGWYLMAPPPFPHAKSPLALDDTLPLAQWKLINSFDTAAACKAEARRLGDSPVDVAAATGNAAQCIATDDPRLKPK